MIKFRQYKIYLELNNLLAGKFIGIVKQPLGT